MYVPYNEDFVEALKGLVPSAKRRWIPEDEAWWIHDDLLDEVEELLHEQFPDYE